MKFGKQVKFFDNTNVQFSAINDANGNPVVQIEISDSKTNWEIKSVFQMNCSQHIPEFLINDAKKNHNRVEFSLKSGKKLEFIFNQNNTIYVSISLGDSKQGIMLSGAKVFALRVLCFKQLSAFYDCSFFDINLLLDLHLIAVKPPHNVNNPLKAQGGIIK